MALRLQSVESRNKFMMSWREVGYFSGGGKRGGPWRERSRGPRVLPAPPDGDHEISDITR